jgi:YD repeat-containing protein
MTAEGGYAPKGLGNAPDIMPEGNLAEEFDIAKGMRRLELIASCDVLDEVEEALIKFESWIGENGALNQLMIAQDLPPIGSRLLALFHDVKAETEPEKVRDRLSRLGEEEMNKRWGHFKLAAALVKAQTRTAPVTHATQWMLGPQVIDGVSARRKFALAYGKGAKTDWGVLKEVLTIDQAAEWLLELAEPEEKESISFELEIDPNVSQEILWRHFGEYGPGLLRAILPKELQGLVRKIKIEAAPRERVDEYGEALEDYPPSFGSFNHGTRELVMALTPELRIGNVIELFSHEFSHALCSEDSKKGRGIRRVFIEVAAKSPNNFSAYVQDNYALLGIEQGFEEDFAVSMQHFFLSPEVLAEFSEERYQAIIAIFGNYYPEVDLENFLDRINAWGYEAQVRERKDLELARELIEESTESHFEVLNWFSGLEWKPLEYLHVRGPANESSTELNRIQGTRTKESYDAEGKLYESRMTFASNEQMRLFFDAEYDPQGRLTGYSRDLGEVHAYFQFHYVAEESFPDRIDVYHGEDRLAKIVYEKTRDGLREVVYEHQNEEDYTVMEHTIKEGKVIASAATIDGEVVFEKRRSFDGEGQEVSEMIVSSEGIILMQNTYEHTK